MTAALWLGDAPLLLASGSTTRRDMLLAAGVPIEVARPEIDERAVEAPLRARGAPADAVAAALACAKALSVSVLKPGRLVLGADQTLSCGEAFFHKPTDATAAAAQISALAGRSHALHAAFVLARDGVVVAQGGQSATLSMRALTPELISTYVELAGPAILGSVGAYQVEGLGAQLFEAIEGDHFTILGLPLLAVLAALREQGHLAR